MFRRQRYASMCRKALEGFEIPCDVRFGNRDNAWSREEATRLLELCRKGYRSFEIAKMLNKSPKSIQKAFRRFRFPSLHNVCPRSGMDNDNWKGGVHIGKGGYLYRRSPSHPHANHAGYVLEHRLVVEAHLRRYLLPTEVVHHKDGNPANNDISNLEVFSSNGSHLRATLKGVRHNMTPEGRRKLSDCARTRWIEYRRNNSIPKVGRPRAVRNTKAIRSRS